MPNTIFFQEPKVVDVSGEKSQMSPQVPPGMIFLNWNQATSLFMESRLALRKKTHYTIRMYEEFIGPFMRQLSAVIFPADVDPTFHSGVSLNDFVEVL